MRRKNLLFVTCVAFIIVLIVASLLTGIHGRIYRQAISPQIDPTRPAVALTFDDGPNPRYTPQVLDILYEQQVPATFFLVGEKFPGNKPLIKEMAYSGHEIESHTFSHPDLTTLTTEQIQQEIRQTEEGLKKILPNYTIQYLRPPYGRYTEKVEKATDLSLMLWTIDSWDWGKPDADKIYNTVVSVIKDGDIIVFHDDNPETVKALRKIIPELKARNFQFLTVSQMCEMEQSDMIE